MKLLVTVDFPDDFYITLSDASLAVVIARRMQDAFDSEWSNAKCETVRVVEVKRAVDPDAQCRDHGCARWRCDEDHPAHDVEQRIPVVRP